ncbi:hypothetical protein BFO_0334 [Tannerella forsythia 92A2]|uniref:Uncharacterized protein n=1 Tax=Tannerella forsythia (strain ATCC 43037 / JCM 10827 / CCUG 21028 A / KCTC 5666 / FDC 338) TaxID=203275 RepID=G8UK30_TANFA|nr:hypothetical protein BFO_0334 [Tannerella forsythia 92A2]
MYIRLLARRRYTEGLFFCALSLLSLARCFSIFLLHIERVCPKRFFGTPF